MKPYNKSMLSIASVLPKKHFQWDEPKAFLKLNDAFEQSKLRWWSQPLWTLISAALLMSNWYVVRLNPHKQPPPPLMTALAVAFSGGLFLVYGIPWIISRCPSQIRFYDTYLIRIRGNIHRQIKYSEIASYTWRGREDFTTLILKHGKKQRDFFLGVPSEISQEAVDKFLLDRNVFQHPEST
ncbi:MAG: hypothetical protein JWL90_3763 [Chthoniobacteraceae bacterium]|nr:hypothetical protein [Chthoniobacteraceae bacterium]